MKEQKLLLIEKLYNMWQRGDLGGAVLPEDDNPNLDKASQLNYMYFTLPMGLNYRRSSYHLWESALATFNDKETRYLYDIESVLATDRQKIKKDLIKHNLALFRDINTDTWIRLCQTIKDKFAGDIRKLFSQLEFDVNKIRNYIQKKHRSDFPYLAGIKICDVWLAALVKYTDLKLKNICELDIAPDTHIIKSSYHLGLIDSQEFKSPYVQKIVIRKWRELLDGSKFCPVDLHTALWLWSRTGFIEIK